MRMILLIPLFSVLASNLYAHNFFLENSGQIKDQYHHYRADIDYSLCSDGLTIFIGKGSMHYQFSKQRDKHINSYRLDVSYEGYDPDAKLIANERQPYFENYYLPGCNDIQVHSYKKLVYQDIYPHIDQVLYIKDGKLEQDFVINPGGDPSQIRLRYSGASNLYIATDGSLVATSPMGSVTEQPPQCYTFGGGKINAYYKIRGNTISFDIASYSGALVIDPSIAWGTYYGTDTSFETAYGLACHGGAVYIAGTTTSAYANTIATTGAHQTTYGGGQYDAFIAKMDTNGVNRLWATYYGGSSYDAASAITCDNNGNVYVAGSTSSSNNISTAGSQQPAYSDSGDVFLAKFNSSGLRQWATYFGNIHSEGLSSVSCDNAGNVLIAGTTQSPNGISTAGCHQPVYGGGGDAYIAKYNGLGQLQWATYYGGSGSENSGGICTDAQGNIYLSGGTQSSAGIASAGSYQQVLNGSSDAFLAMFNASGMRQWATYYGGSSDENSFSVACDGTGNIILSGSSFSDSGIATPGSYQVTNAGAHDNFIAKFNNLGNVQWATYYGGIGEESAYSVTTGDSDYIYLTGTTNSTSGMATPGAYQATFGGDQYDGFIVRFNSIGERAGATYYGGSARDPIKSVTFYDGYVYVAGGSYSTNNIATPGTFKPTFTGGGFLNAALAKFIFNDTAVPNPVTVKEPVTKPISLNLYPNPNNGSFTVSGYFMNVKELNLEIWTEKGQTICRRTGVHVINGHLLEKLDIPSTLPGNYILRITGINGKWTLPFVIKDIE